MLELPNLLSGDELARIREELATSALADGRRTAGVSAGKVKNNREVAGDHPAAQRIGEIALKALNANRAFREFAIPQRIRMPIVSVYEPGMEYGDHVDAPVMGEGPVHATRTDLSVTLFISDLGDYDGGELVLAAPTGEARSRMEAGGAVVYPTSYIHRVAPVTRGARVAVVTWMQSRVRDHEERQILYDLACAIRTLPPGSGDAERLRLHHVFTRLYQRWSVV